MVSDLLQIKNILVQYNLDGFKFVLDLKKDKALITFFFHENMLQLCQTTYLAKKAIKKNCIRSTKKEDSFIAVVPELWQCQTESIIAVEVSFFKKPKYCVFVKLSLWKKMNREPFLVYFGISIKSRVSFILVAKQFFFQTHGFWKDLWIHEELQQHTIKRIWIKFCLKL